MTVDIDACGTSLTFIGVVGGALEEYPQSWTQRRHCGFAMLGALFRIDLDHKVCGKSHRKRSRGRRTDEKIFNMSPKVHLQSKGVAQEATGWRYGLLRS